MGKSKKRIFNRNINSNGFTIKRHDIVYKIISDIRNNSQKEENNNLVSLFGISIEEFAEAGASLEELSIIKKVFY